MFWKKTGCFILSVILIAAFSACGTSQEGTASGSESSQAGSPSQPKEDFPVDIGDTRISQSPKAVVSLTPSTTEMLFDMGYGGRVIGVSDYCDYPDKVEDKSRCGTALQPNFDAIAQRPVDLVVSSVPLVESDLIRFQQADVPVLILKRGSTLDEVQQNYRNLALAMDGAIAGQSSGEEYWTKLQSLLDEAEALGKAYLESSQAPLRAILLREMSYGMATGDTFEQELLSLLGFHNEGEPYTNWLYPKEDVAALEPDVIFAAKELDAQEIIASVVYAPVAAAKNKMVMNVDMAVFERQSPRMFQTLLDMALFAYPQQ